jgi:hypothetical protein
MFNSRAALAERDNLAEEKSARNALELEKFKVIHEKE